jgi:hypothetical protein
MQLEANKLDEVIQRAFDAAGQSRSNARRWQIAIARAKQELENNPFIHFDGTALIILSPSAEVYETSRTCQCNAYCQGFPCWHRAAWRIISRYYK